jgi:hypothetical protein
MQVDEKRFWSLGIESGRKYVARTLLVSRDDDDGHCKYASIYDGRYLDTSPPLRGVRSPYLLRNKAIGRAETAGRT